ncbi:MAG TPA: hypothetical protein VKX17_14350 [Planctomycetota bacterium]|nr:hypothetical protein [Planctomycetota bacterium]
MTGWYFANLAASSNNFVASLCAQRVGRAGKKECDWTVAALCAPDVAQVLRNQIIVIFAIAQFLTKTSSLFGAQNMRARVAQATWRNVGIVIVFWRRGILRLQTDQARLCSVKHVEPVVIYVELQ